MTETSSIQVGADRLIDPVVSERERAFHAHLRAEYDKAPNPFVEGDEGGTVPVQLLDKMITKLELRCLSADIWQEDGRDVCAHIVPARGEFAFTDSEWEVVRPQANNVFRRVFDDLAEVSCMGRYFGHRTHDINITRKSDRDKTVADLFDIRMIGLFRQPLGAKRMIEAITLLDRVVAGLEPPA